MFLIRPVHLKVIQGVHLIRCYHFMLGINSEEPDGAKVRAILIG